MYKVCGYLSYFLKNDISCDFVNAKIINIKRISCRIDTDFSVCEYRILHSI